MIALFHGVFVYSKHSPRRKLTQKKMLTWFALAQAWRQQHTKDASRTPWVAHATSQLTRALGKIRQAVSTLAMVTGSLEDNGLRNVGVAILMGIKEVRLGAIVRPQTSGRKGTVSMSSQLPAQVSA